MIKKHFLIFFVFILVLLPLELAHAYIDPGTGSFVIQMIIAALVGISFTLKVYWKKTIDWMLKTFKTRYKKTKNEENGD